MAMETWKEVKEFEGIYEISDNGNVKSLHGKGRILSKRFDARGYIQYIFYKNGIKTSFKEHHLVWDHFGKGLRNGRVVNVDHIDDNKTNNNIKNLQLLTNRENISKGKIKQNKSSKFTGVYKPKQIQGYQAYISINKKHIYLGSFKTEELASEAYQNALSKII